MKIDNILIRAESTTARVSEMHGAFDAIQQPRSDYQIEKFVVGQYDSPERQYMQCVLELSIKHDNIRRALLERQRIGLDIEALGQRANDSRASLDLLERQYDLENTDRAILGALREFDVLFAIYESLPKFTHEQLQAAEADYWQRRLRRQANDDIATIGAVAHGNREALRQIGVDPALLEAPDEAP